MIRKLDEWMRQYNLDSLVCYVDCADSGGFIDGLVLEAKNQRVWNITFVPSTKIQILTRVYFENLLMSYNCLMFNKNCENLVREIKNAKKSKEGKVREDYDDHAINAFEYAWIPTRKKLKRWKLFKDPTS